MGEPPSTPFDNQVVANFDDLTDPHVTQLLAQAHKMFQSSSKT